MKSVWQVTKASPWGDDTLRVGLNQAAAGGV